jgi:hypothetical protein
VGAIGVAIPELRSGGILRDRGHVLEGRSSLPRGQAAAASWDRIRMLCEEWITMLARRWAGGLAAAAMTAGMLAAGTVPAQAAMHGMELQAALHGGHAYPRAGGTAAYESGDHGRELEVHVSHIARLAGWKLVVYVHGARAGTMTVSRAGYARLDRHRGVPACRSGQPVRVRTRSGTLVASGTFRAHHDD